MKKGFTLIELLVVIGIIALLASILMPALAKARQQGKSAICRSNLHQVFVAAQCYAMNNDDYYPPAYLPDPDPMDSLMMNPAWDFVSIKDWDTGTLSVEPGILWEGEMIDEIQQCPSFKGQPNAQQVFSGYNYNVSFIGYGQGLGGPSDKKTARASEVSNGALNAIFGDGQYYDGGNKYMRSPFPHDDDQFSARAAGTQGYRHSNKTNVAWCDGHVSSQKEIYTETIPSQQELILQYNLENPNNKVGFLSPDNSSYDLK
ncbi:MAG: prepilin-type N-terminal cleavage/methylation domain-containing protein [Planctomycetota bacterium]|jgi:prepilin-type N-terminal cleavage/methylation domain-containing protein/prepilin-type processing-associated H-X9-DG protein